MRHFPPDLRMLFFFTACGGRDPILDRADAAEPSASASAPAQASARSDAPRKGIPADPKPVQPAAPPAGQPGSPHAASGASPAPGQAKPPPPPGEGAGFTLSGSVVLADHKGGAIRVDVFDGDQKAASGGGKRPGVVGMARLDAPGAFEVKIPAGTEEVWLGAFADEDQDGKPGPLDPEVWYAANPVRLRGDVSDIQLVLERREPPPSP